MAARLGKGAIPAYKRALAEGEDWMAILDAGLGLGAIGAPPLGHDGRGEAHPRSRYPDRRPRQPEERSTRRSRPSATRSRAAVLLAI